MRPLVFLVHHNLRPNMILPIIVSLFFLFGKDQPFAELEWSTKGVVCLEGFQDIASSPFENAFRSLFEHPVDDAGFHDRAIKCKTRRSVIPVALVLNQNYRGGESCLRSLEQHTRKLSTIYVPLNNQVCSSWLV